MLTGELTPRTVMAFFPDYIFKRFDGYDEESLARDAGLSVDAITMNALGSLVYAPEIADNGLLSVARYRWRRPYLARDPWTPLWGDIIDAGFAMRAGESWSLSESGWNLCNELHRKARHHLESLEVARMDLKALAVTLMTLVDAIPADAERTWCAHNGLPLQDELGSDILRVDRAISELWNFRDDSHIAAWQSEGYSGPTLDVLSQVWEGKTTIDQVVSALEYRQESEDVERGIAHLVAVGELDRIGDSLVLTPHGRDRRESIERDTDDRYFRKWPKGEDLAQLGDGLRTLVSSLPAV